MVIENRSYRTVREGLVDSYCGYELIHGLLFIGDGPKGDAGSITRYGGIWAASRITHEMSRIMREMDEAERLGSKSRVSYLSSSLLEEARRAAKMGAVTLIKTVGCFKT